MVRTFIVFILVALNALFFKNAYQQIKTTSAANLLMLAVSGIATTLSWVFYYRAMKEGPVSYVAAIDKASIVITLILSFTLLREPVTPKILLGGGFILTGMLILVWK
jgi:transporter family protein